MSKVWRGLDYSWGNCQNTKVLKTILNNKSIPGLYTKLVQTRTSGEISKRQILETWDIWTPDEFTQWKYQLKYAFSLDITDGQLQVEI